jgi:hypothetical protein
MAGRAARSLKASRAAAVAGPLGWAAGALFGCGSELQLAPVGPRPAAAEKDAVQVEYPPPPAQVEQLPGAPGPHCVWVDGQWEPVAAGWEWAPGGWVVPPAACHYAPPAVQWRGAPGGQGLVRFHLAGRWFRSDGSAAACDAPKPCPR